MYTKIFLRLEPLGLERTTFEEPADAAPGVVRAST